MARSVASILYWYGEDDEEMALDEQCGDDLAEREEMREQMVTRELLECSYPAWACNLPPRPRQPLCKMAGGARDVRLRAIQDLPSDGGGGGGQGAQNRVTLQGNDAAQLADAEAKGLVPQHAA